MPMQRLRPFDGKYVQREITSQFMQGLSYPDPSITNFFERETLFDQLTKQERGTEK